MRASIYINHMIDDYNIIFIEINDEIMSLLYSLSFNDMTHILLGYITITFNKQNIDIKIKKHLIQFNFFLEYLN